jgi:RimJ/RimL family protein N-acetyltransferase
VRQSAQGHGYATEIAHILTRMAFEKLGFERLEIRSDINNPASGGVARRLGFEFLTVFKKNKRSPSGELWDLEIHARLDAAGLPDMAVTYRDA